jgi:hypothetical protein
MFCAKEGKEMSPFPSHADVSLLLAGTAADVHPSKACQDVGLVLQPEPKSTSRCVLHRRPGVLHVVVAAQCISKRIGQSRFCHSRASSTAAEHRGESMSRDKMA